MQIKVCLEIMMKDVKSQKRALNKPGIVCHFKFGMGTEHLEILLYQVCVPCFINLLLY